MFIGKGREYKKKEHPATQLLKTDRRHWNFAGQHISTKFENRMATIHKL